MCFFYVLFCSVVYVLLYVCSYVCMCVIMYVCMYVCVSVYVSVYVCMCKCVCMYVCMYICVCTQTLFWAIAVGCNAPWAIFPTILLVQSFRECRNAFVVSSKKDQ